MNEIKSRSYDKEFKLNAVKLYLASGSSYPKISRELGIPIGTLATWVKSYKEDGNEAFPGKGNLKPSDAEVANLRKELAITREERDILKKALGIFSLPRR
jgi:transposase-like protein